MGLSRHDFRISSIPISLFRLSLSVTVSTSPLFSLSSVPHLVYPRLQNLSSSIFSLSVHFSQTFPSCWHRLITISPLPLVHVFFLLYSPHVTKKMNSFLANVDRMTWVVKVTILLNMLPMIPIQTQASLDQILDRMNAWSKRLAWKKSTGLNGSSDIMRFCENGFVDGLKYKARVFSLVPGNTRFFESLSHCVGQSVVCCWSVGLLPAILTSWYITLSSQTLE